MLYFLHAMPNLAIVIPAMDLIDEKLTTASLDRKYSPAIRAAIGLAKRTLNRYYQLTDSTEVYRIAMGKCSSTQRVNALKGVPCSSTSTTQTYILQEYKLGGGLDRHRQDACPRRVRVFVQH